MNSFYKSLLCLAVVCIVIGAFVFWLSDPLYLKAPNDHELIAVFQDHRLAFEKLRQMVITDSESYISASHLDGKLSNARKREYETLLSQINPGLVLTTSAQSVRFVFASGGLSAVGPGWLKGIEYIPERTDREGVILKSLDRPVSLAIGRVYLRQIEPKWFLVFQNSD